MILTIRNKLFAIKEENFLQLKQVLVMFGKYGVVVFKDFSEI
jgi:hypothetical protein